MRTACVYHSRDLDGWMSAAIVQLWWEKNWRDVDSSSLSMIGYDYGDHIPDLEAFDQVVICDTCLPVEVMQHLNQEKSLVWIDHHQSSIDALKQKQVILDGLKDTKMAACELTWMYFFPSKRMPEIVRLLGRYDCFGHKNTHEETKVLEFQYGARYCIHNYQEAYEYLLMSLSSADNVRPEASIWEKGKTVYSFLCKEALGIYSQRFILTLKNPEVQNQIYLFACVNHQRFNPVNFGIDYHADGYDGAACFWFKEGMWHFSIYNDNGKVDCATIAKSLGGGGHKGASGFILTTEELTKLIAVQ